MRYIETEEMAEKPEDLTLPASVVARIIKESVSIMHVSVVSSHTDNAW